MIRFAVGSPEEAYSAVWILFTQGNDVYLSSRLMGRYLKISLHAKDVWRFAWTKESEILMEGTNDRVIHRWRRPPQFRPGWTRGISVIVPWTPIGRHFPAVDVYAVGGYFRGFFRTLTACKKLHHFVHECTLSEVPSCAC